MATADRPDPDALLARLEAEEARARRGRLKIFFGACPGVGKTYAMLTAACRLRAEGVEVVVGVAESHGRAETEALLAGLELLPRRLVEYRGHRLAEFDLDAALSRRPGLLLVDELAHSNAPGSRHPKRWQDVEELLAAGIDVCTTVNVQHLESLSDVVGGITGVRVWETFPDRVFDAAEEVVLVDLPPEELLQRLREGKVYLPQQAERALHHFFRKGNLLALRELALRRTADRVDAEVLAYRREQAVTAVWGTRDSLLACVGPAPGGERLVRSAARLATQLGQPWHAIYVETPQLQRLPAAERARILNTLRLARELGAESATLPGDDAAAAAVAYARDHNLGKLVVGRAGRRWWWWPGFAERAGRAAPDLDVVTVATAPDPRQSHARQPPRSPGGHGRWLWSAAAVAATTLLATPLLDRIDLANIVMLYLLAVVLVALRLGRGPATLAALLAVLAFDVYFVPPRLSLAVSDIQYLITFAVMLAVALTIGRLTAGLRFQAAVAESRERRTRALYEMARELSSALTVEQIAEIGGRFVARGFHAGAAIFVPDAAGQVAAVGASPAAADPAIAQWACDHGEAAGLATDTLPSAPLLYLPLKAPMGVRGVLAVAPREGRWLPTPEQQRLLETSATLVAIALERVHYIAVAQEALLSIESERLRNSLLATLSHDLRTPLTALAGLADSLPLAGPGLPPAQEEIARAIREEALRTSALVDNLLDMARLQSGRVTLHREWQPLEEVVGAALQARAGLLAHHAVRVDLPAELPLLEFDAVLLERLFCNLLENAARHTPAGSRIEVSARPLGEWVEIAVADDGPGIPPGREEELFDRFARGGGDVALGSGLGLAIVRAVAEAHGGRARAENRPEGGARFIVTLPAGEPPAPPPEEGEEMTG